MCLNNALPCKPNPLTAMASIVATSLINFLSPTNPALTTREGFSGALGSISLACWIFLLLPQLIENYRNGSAEAISLAFIFVWFLGDVCNLAGALWAGLVPTVIAIAVYFCIADGVLIGQCLYYHIKNQRKDGRDALRSDSTAEAIVGEESPLLGRRRTESLTIPGSGQRRSSAVSRRRSSVPREDPLAKILEESDESGARLWFKNIFSILAIIAVGTFGWSVAYESGVWKPSPEKTAGDQESMATGAQILGYLSAVAYLGARIPQIIKNARERSCEGICFNIFWLCPANSTRSLTTLLHFIGLRQCYLWSWNSFPFNRERLLPHKSSLAYWEFGHNGGRCHHLCAVSHLLNSKRGVCCCVKRNTVNTWLRRLSLGLRRLTSSLPTLSIMLS